MPVSEITRLKAKAGKLKVADYRTMGEEDLRAAIEKAENGASPSAKSKVSPARKAGTKTAAATKTSPPATKSTPQKSSTEAAKGKAKRETATEARKSTATKATGAKSRKGAEVIVHQTQPGRVGEGGYTNLDRGAIDWTAETTIAQSGKRAEVLAALRKHKGNYALAFEEVRDKALEWFPTALRSYPKSPSKLAAAERMTRWLVNRVAYDFAYKTGQHLGRAAKKAETTKTTAKKTPQKAAGAVQKAAKPKKAAKSTLKPRKAQKAAQGAGKKLPATAKARQSTRRRGAR